MKPYSYALAMALSANCLAGTAHAQWIVEDPAAVGLLGTINGQTAATVTQLTTANTTLQRIAVSTQATSTTTANMLTMMQTPTPLVGAFTSIEAGGTAEATGDAIEYMPHLNGATSTSPTATKLVAAEKLAITADETKGIALGNPALEQARRQRLIATNLLGEAYADLLMYGKRYVAAETMMPKLSALNLKQAMVYNAGLQVKILQQLNLLGQSISTNTAAVAQSWLQPMKIFFRIKEDREAASALF